MIRDARLALLSLVYETRYTLRNKEASFFTLVFPVFLFVLFGAIWGRSGSYLQMLLPGVIGISIASDALFSVGPVIRRYAENGVLKFLRSLPPRTLAHFGGTVANRVLLMSVSVFLLCGVAALGFDVAITGPMIVTDLLGVVVGGWAFSAIGLTAAFASDSVSPRGLLNLLYLPMLFVSGAFYPISILPDSLQTIAYLLPLTHLVEFLKGQSAYGYLLVGWGLLFTGAAYVVFCYRQEER